ncbi:MAG: hypothetical protein HGA45_21530 [Chloroflexales bacterium]|nr:hypothetical protein [Chloroflexales bacterium]
MTAWRALSERTLAAIDATVLPGQNARQDALRRLFLAQRHDFHRARLMYDRLAADAGAQRALSKRPGRPATAERELHPDAA